MSTRPEPVEFAFPGPVRDRIVADILSGTKTSTSSLRLEYEVNGDRLPHVGDLGTVIDSQGVSVAVIQVTEVSVVRLGEVDEAHALAEGEGFTGVADWRAAHERFWTSPELEAELGRAVTLDDETPVVLERFRVVG